MCLISFIRKELSFTCKDFYRKVKFAKSVTYPIRSYINYFFLKKK